ncbi:hypothetical protein [Micromonospora sp. NPDC049645]|uniref:hypothetical protein n=1 Tax=Micromonospora sp. NPDC049645 TaxID=3155508 RepID=UPI003416ACEB
MPHRRAILIAGGRHPFEQWPLLACVVVGSVLILAPSLRPPSLAGTMPGVLLVCWLLLLAAGGLAGLVGGHWSGDVEAGLLIEAAGVLAVGCMCTLYVLGLAVANPATALTAGGLLAGLGAGALHRCGQIVGELRRIARAEVLGVSVEVPLLVDPAAPGDVDQGDGPERGEPS